jgi:adenylate cyclase, class 2
MSTSGNREIEIKLPVKNPEEAVELLQRAGFRISRDRVFESNAVFDTPDHELRGSGRLLRLRQVGLETILTYKGPPAPGPHKSREELETRIETYPAAEAILDRLGFRPCFLYEKYRTEFTRPGEDGVATVDETPIGAFMELEGAPEWIDRAASQLGFSGRDYITASYGALYLAWCAERNIPPTHMKF